MKKLKPVVTRIEVASIGVVLGDAVVRSQETNAPDTTMNEAIARASDGWLRLEKFLHENNLVAKLEVK